MGGKNVGIPFFSEIGDEYAENILTARAVEKDSQYEASQRRLMGEKLMKQQIASYGVSGVELEGTPEEQIRTDLKDAEIEAMNIIYTGKMKKAEIRRRATNARKAAYTGLAFKAGMAYLTGGASLGFEAGSKALTKPDKAVGTTKYSKNYLGDK